MAAVTEPKEPDNDPYSLVASEAEMNLITVQARKGGGFLLDVRHADNVFAMHECANWREVVALLDGYGSEVEGAVTRARALADQLKAHIRDSDEP